MEGGDNAGDSDCLTVTDNVTEVDEQAGEVPDEDLTKGKIVVSGLALGTYVFREVKAPEGFLPTDEEKEATLTENDPTRTVIFYNEPIPTGLLTVFKRDGKTLKRIGGAEFKICPVEGSDDQCITVVDNQEPDSSPWNGIITVALPLGKWVLVEVKAPTGYVGSGEPVEVSLTKWKKWARVTVMNDPEDGEDEPPTGTIVIHKVDGDTQDYVTVDGAEFEICPVDATADCLRVIDNNVDATDDHVMDEDETVGVIVVSGLELGLWKVSEVKAPPTYEKTDDEQQVELTENQPNRDVTFVNNKESTPDDRPPSGRPPSGNPEPPGDSEVPGTPEQPILIEEEPLAAGPEEPPAAGPEAPALPVTGGSAAGLVTAGMAALAAGLVLRRRWS